MSKSSRPDIQVLEDRVDRLCDQLLEYKEIRLYRTTKDRLAAVAKKLADCQLLINDIVSSDGTVASSTPLCNPPEYTSTLTEFNEDADLSDQFLMGPAKAESETSQNYSPKAIVSTYSKRFQEAFDTEGHATGIIQVNQFWQILNSWYQNRFTPQPRNPDFHFKANRIHEWVNLFIIAAGHALHNGLFPAFVSDTSAWIHNLNTSKDGGWVLPYSIMRLQPNLSESVTLEAVLIEKMVKPFVYDEDFYLEEMRTIYLMAANTNTDPENDLSIQSILERCPKLVRTSSFDIKKYDKEVQ